MTIRGSLARALVIAGITCSTIQAGQGITAAVNAWPNSESRHQILVKVPVVHVGGEDQKSEKWPAEPVNWDFVVRGDPDQSDGNP